MSIYCRLADRVFEINNKYPYLESFCSDYIIDKTEPNYVIEVSESEILAECENEASNFSLPYLEILAVHRKITEALASEDCILMHAATIEYKGKAYAFSAKSGTGKTTHITLWEKLFGEEVKIINGDKPFVRRRVVGDKTEFIAYGTPWCGKEGKNTNTSATLAGFCLLERSEENFARECGEEAIPQLLGLIHQKKDPEYIGFMLSFVDSFVRNVPIYRLGVNMNDDAAIMARDMLTKNQ